MPESEKEKEVEITCPACSVKQMAFITYNPGWHFPAYVHICRYCGYTITESEWNETEEE